MIFYIFLTIWTVIGLFGLIVIILLFKNRHVDRAAEIEPNIYVIIDDRPVVKSDMECEVYIPPFSVN